MLHSGLGLSLKGLRFRVSNSGWRAQPKPLNVGQIMAPMPTFFWGPGRAVCFRLRVQGSGNASLPTVSYPTPV